MTFRSLIYHSIHQRSRPNARAPANTPFINLENHTQQLGDFCMKTTAVAESGIDYVYDCFIGGYTAAKRDKEEFFEEF